MPKKVTVEQVFKAIMDFVVVYEKLPKEKTVSIIVPDCKTKKQLERKLRRIIG